MVEEAAEKTTFDVMVEAIVSDKRVAVLKVIRKLTSLGLAEARNYFIT
jgi:large subunit ribosomal protein L7/L12